MGLPDITVSEPEVVIGPDGLPRLSQAYLDAYERFMQTLVTEDDRPVDSLFAATQASLLIKPLYDSWTHPRFGRRFIARGNVGIFYAFHQPPVVPDMFLSLDVVLPSNLLKNVSSDLREVKRALRSRLVLTTNKPPTEPNE